MAEKIVLDIEIGTSGSQRTLGQLEEQAELLNEELRKVPLGTKAFKDLQKQLIGVNKEIKNTELSMEALDNEQVASELGSVAGAVGDMTSAFVLLGGSGGALEETAQNIEKALGISMAFKGAIEGVSSGRKLFNNLLKQSNLLTNINNQATKVAEGIYSNFSKSVDVTSKSFRTLKGAIIATGIGALVVLVGELIANFDKLKGAINGVSSEQKDLLQAQKESLEVSKEKLDAISEQENILKLQGKSEKEILNLKIQQIKATIEQQKEVLILEQQQRKAQIEAEERNKRILQEVIEWTFLVPRTLVKGVDLFGEALQKTINKLRSVLGQEPITINFGLDEKVTEGIESVSELLFDPEKTKEQLDETLKETEKGLIALENKLAGFELSIIALDKKTAEERKKITDKVTENAIKSARAREAVEIDSNNKLIDQKKAFWETMGQLSAEAAEKERLRREKELAEALAAQNATFDLAQSGVNALLQLNEAFTGETEAQQKKAFERRKKLEIAGALISSAQGVVNILSNKSAVPSPFDIPFKAAQIGVLLATTVAQIAKIKQQQFSGGGSVSSPNVGGGGIPTISPVTNTSTLVPQEPTQVFVTETDISNTQNKVNVIEAQATIK
jgi:hypothetical protein